ncbi:MAG: hypothetical protein PHD51_00420 [Patescibacteria group bacterium]|nr:hypothetical protein [Patescibacteria group bacterium]MDD5490668.1 hypothetical protein [Patescibacteria group bacterium]
MENQRPQKLSPFKLFLLQYFKIITPLVAILILVLGLFFILKPKYNEVKISGALNLEAKQEELAAKKLYLEQLISLRENYGSISEDDIAKIRGILPLEEDIPGLMAQFEKIVQGSGFNLSSLNISPAKNLFKNKGDEDVKKLLVVATIAGGDYSKFKDMLSVVESNLRLFDVRSINFTSGSDLYTLNISTYYLANK